MVSTIEINVHLFALLRERAGTAQLSLTIPEGCTAAEAATQVWQQLGVEAPMSSDAIAFAVNREYAPDDSVMADGDELALIPPICGGAPEASCGGRTLEHG